VARSMSCREGESARHAAPAPVGGPRDGPHLSVSALRRPSLGRRLPRRRRRRWCRACWGRSGTEPGASSAALTSIDWWGTASFTAGGRTGVPPGSPPRSKRDRQAFLARSRAQSGGACRHRRSRAEPGRGAPEYPARYPSSPCSTRPFTAPCRTRRRSIRVPMRGPNGAGAATGFTASATTTPRRAPRSCSGRELASLG
jgi:hypothetical protein